VYLEFGKAKNWKRLIVPSVLLYGLFAIPVSWVFAYVAIDTMLLKNFVIALVVIIFVFVIPSIHIKNLYLFPPVEMDENFLIVNQPLQKRVAYTLRKVTWERAFLRGVFLLHNGVPTFINFHSLSREEVSKILSLIRANKKIQSSKVCS